MTVLGEIVAAHRRAAAEDRRDPARLIDEARQHGPAARDFRAALSAPGLSVIAEFKRRSPSKGDLARDLDPALTAKAYEAGGAAAMSVLTDAAYFGGSPNHLKAARAATDLPVLRKDFTVDARDVADAKLMGADAILLIVATLTDEELASFRAVADDLGVAALVEVHDETELQRALDAGATIVGINQRDLRTFEIDRTLAARLADRIPDGILKVAESGIRNRQDVPDNIDAVLVGESLVTAPNPSEAIRDLRGDS